MHNSYSTAARRRSSLPPASWKCRTAVSSGVHHCCRVSRSFCFTPSSVIVFSAGTLTTGASGCVDVWHAACHLLDTFSSDFVPLLETVHHVTRPSIYCRPLRWQNARKRFGAWAWSRAYTLLSCPTWKCVRHFTRLVKSHFPSIS